MLLLEINAKWYNDKSKAAKGNENKIRSGKKVNYIERRSIGFGIKE